MTILGDFMQKVAKLNRGKKQILSLYKSGGGSSDLVQILEPDPDPHYFVSVDPDPPLKFRSGSAGPQSYH